MFKVCKEVIVYINVIFKFKNHKKKDKKVHTNVSEQKNVDYQER